ncbi:MAG: hypothetical protein M3Y07_14920 [Acidobacteriota bacterium]|nr:hypothetical protein [Acidobacteriota bacterium]
MIALYEPGAVCVLDGAPIIDHARTRDVFTGLSAEIGRREPDGSWMLAIDNPYTPR